MPQKERRRTAAWPIAAALGLSIAVSACIAAEQPPRPTVVATTTVVADLVREIAGGRVAIDCLMGAGVDPHSYRATPRDADRLAKADLVVASGLHLEGKLAELLERLSRQPAKGVATARGGRVVFAAEAIPDEKLIKVADGAVDPHVWFDPSLWRFTAGRVADAISALDPAFASAYREAAVDYEKRLMAVHARLESRIAKVPEKRRVLITAHDAFGYFGRAYGIEVVGVQGVSTESEAGLADINRIVSLVVERGIPGVFVETSVSDRNVEAICEGVRAKGGVIRVGGRLYSDALGPEGSGADTLLTMLEKNVETIVEGLSPP